MAAVIDAHHHLWQYEARDYGWIDDSMAALRCDFTAAELTRQMRQAGVDRAVAIQARQSVEETEFLLAAARSEPRIAGVVGWLPLRDSQALHAALERFAPEPLLVGARHVVQSEPAGFLEDEAFNHGIRSLTAAGLAYDLLLRADQLAEAASFVDRHPKQRFVLDHLAKPSIATGRLQPWQREMAALAQRPNVWCKLSGMVTEDDWRTWSLSSLRPYLDAVVEAFGMNRLMAGSDWPVCTVASSYSGWWATLHAYFAASPSPDRAAVFGGNAAGFYRLTHAAV